MLARKELIALAIVFILASAYLILMKLWMYNNLFIVSDLFFYHQLIINTLDWKFFYEPGSGMHLGVHSYFALFFFMPFTALFRTASTILVIWSLIFVSGIYPVYCIAKHYAPFGLEKLKKVNFDWKTAIFSMVMVLLYIILPNHLVLFNDGPYGFHLDLLFFPGIMWLFYYAFVNKKNLAYFVTLFLILLIKEEMAIYTACFSFLLLFVKDRRKLALKTFVISVLYFIGSTQMIAYFAGQSFEGTNELTHNVSLFSGYGDGYFEVALYILTHPSVIFNAEFFNILSSSSKDFLYLNIFSPFISLLMLPKLIILMLLPPQRNFPWHYVEIYSFAFLGFMTSFYNVKQVLAKYRSILVKKAPAYNKTYEVLVCILLTLIIYSTLSSFYQNFEHKKIIAREKSPSVQVVDVEIDQIRREIDPDSTVGISLFLIKYFENDTTTFFSNHPLSISRVKRIDPDVYVVQNSDFDSLMVNVVKYFTAEKGHEYIMRRYTNFVLIKKV